MSFREPLLLAALALVPLALLAYWAAQRRRRRYAIRYPAVDVLAGVAGKARGRHVPAVLALAALAALAISLARPERTVAVEQRQGTVMLVHDTSGSMQATDVKPDRLSAARDAARTLISSVPEEFRLGVDLVQHAGRGARVADDRPLAGAARDRGAEGPGRDRDGRRPAAGGQRDPHARHRRRRAAAAAAGRDRAALRRREHVGPRPARGGQDGGEVQDPDLRDRAGHAERQAQAGRRQHDPGAARHRDARLDRAHDRRALVHARRPRATSRRSTRTSARAWRPATRSRRSPRRSPAAR